MLKKFLVIHLGGLKKVFCRKTRILQLPIKLPTTHCITIGQFYFLQTFLHYFTMTLPELNPGPLTEKSGGLQMSHHISGEPPHLLISHHIYSTLLTSSSVLVGLSYSMFTVLGKLTRLEPWSSKMRICLLYLEHIFQKQHFHSHYASYRNYRCGVYKLRNN